VSKQASPGSCPLLDSAAALGQEWCSYHNRPPYNHTPSLYSQDPLVSHPVQEGAITSSLRSPAASCRSLSHLEDVSKNCGTMSPNFMTSLRKLSTVASSATSWPSLYWRRITGSGISTTGEIGDRGSAKCHRRWSAGLCREIFLTKGKDPFSTF
jgi:hypothetical protein